jgi:murein DD-endopeptidase MepM/ murein hydrolase activator NlpD
MADNKKLTPIEKLLKDNPNGFEPDKYQDLISQLATINSAIANPYNASLYEYTDKSYSAATRDDKNKAGESKKIKKNQVYGVILYSKGIFSKDVYIDVPPWNTKLISHPDIFKKESDAKFLKDYEDLIFYPQGIDFLTYPAERHLALVEIPENFPNHTLRNPEDAIFIKQIGGEIIKNKTDVSKAQNGSQSPLALQNAGAPAAANEGTSGGIIKKNDFTGPIPTTGYVTSVFGPRVLKGSNENHPGIDIGASIGTKIYAAEDGLVLRSYPQYSAPAGSGFGGYGQAIFIEHQGYATLYGHCSQIFVKQGEKVTKGQNIGLVGNTGGLSTGPHLHFEKRINYTTKIVNGTKDVVSTGTAVNPETLVQLKNKATPPQAPNSSQPTPVASNQNTSSNKTGKSSSAPTNKPKMLLVNFETDGAKGAATSYKTGAKNIKIREDILTDIKSIKQILNNFDISFTCDALNISLDNNYISHLAKVGLEVHLNPNAALTIDSNYVDDDFYIAPDLNNPIGSNYKLKVYGYVRRKLDYLNNKYKITTEPTDVYDVRESYLKGALRLKRIFKPLIDVTQIFEDYGFIHNTPDIKFFTKSDNLKSNWFIFYKPSKINIGYTYKELLSTVYYDNGESIWNESLIKWDGYKFS